MNFKAKLFTFLNNRKDIVFPLIIVFCLPVLLYLQTLNFGFTGFDDTQIISNNYTFLNNFSNTPHAFLTDAFIIKTSQYYRPLQTVSYMADISLSGGNNAWMYHLTNVLLLGLIACALLLFLRKLLMPMRLAVLSTLIFCVHPLFISSIAWIPARGDLLLMLFSLLSFLFLIEYLQKKKVIWLFLHWLTFTIALFCKETGTFLPFLFVIYYFVFSAECSRSSYRDKQNLLLILLYGISGIGWFWLRSKALENSSVENDIGLMSFLMNLRTLPESLANFFLPFNIAQIPGFSLFKMLTGSAIVVAIVVTFFISKERTKREKLFSLSWFFLLMLPAILYKNDYVDYLSHRFFLPLIGILLFLLFLIPKSWFERHKDKITWVLVVIIVVLSSVTFIKAKPYANSMAFYNAAITQNPKNALMYTNRGTLKMNTGDFQGAISDFRKAIEINPGYAVAYNNLGIAYSAMGNPENAIKVFDKAIALKPNYVVAYNNRGTAFKNKGDLDKAIKDFEKAITLNPSNAEAYNNQGNVFKDKGELDKAINAYEKAITLNPNFANAYYNRGTAYCIKGDLDKGIQDFNIAISLNPNDPETYNNRGTAYSNLGYLEMAINNYDKAIALNPNYAEAYSNRGSAYKAMGMEDKAEQDFKMYSALIKNR